MVPFCLIKKKKFFFYVSFLFAAVAVVGIAMQFSPLHTHKQYKYNLYAFGEKIHNFDQQQKKKKKKKNDLLLLRKEKKIVYLVYSLNTLHVCVSDDLVIIIMIVWCWPSDLYWMRKKEIPKFNTENVKNNESKRISKK